MLRRSSTYKLLSKSPAFVSKGLISTQPRAEKLPEASPTNYDDSDSRPKPFKRKQHIHPENLKSRYSPPSFSENLKVFTDMQQKQPKVKRNLDPAIFKA